MAIDIFTKETFEEVIKPFDAVKLGSLSGELCWLVPVTEKAGMLVRSSIDPYTERSRSTGKDSIRVYPITCQRIPTLKGDVWSYHFQGESDCKWTSREPGWNTRLQLRIKQVRAMIEKAGNCTVCGKPLKLLKTKKEGPNKGRWFAACEREHKNFMWLDQDKE